MKNDSCPHENLVATAARTGKWEESLIAHANECVVCREVKEVAVWMGSLAGQFENEPVPHEKLVWLRSLIREEQARQDRALRPLAVAQGILVLGATAWLAVPQTQSIGVLLTAFSPT